MKIFLIIAVLLLAGCASDPTKDGLVAETEDGKVIQIKHRMGDMYFVNYLPNCTKEHK